MQLIVRSVIPRSGDLLVELSADQMQEDLALARGQPLVPAAERLLTGARGPGRGVLSQRAADRREQDVAVDRFREEVHRPALDSAHAVRYHAVPRHEDNRKRHAARRQCRLQLETALVGQTDVEDDAAGRLQIDRVQKVERADVRARLESGGREQPRRRLPCEFVIVDDMNDRAGHAHVVPGAVTRADLSLHGSVTVNVAPPSGLLLAAILPRWASTMVRAMVSPIPMPSVFVVTKGSNN